MKRLTAWKPHIGVLCLKTSCWCTGHYKQVVMNILRGSRGWRMVWFPTISIRWRWGRKPSSLGGNLPLGITAPTLILMILVIWPNREVLHWCIWHHSAAMPVKKNMQSVCNHPIMLQWVTMREVPQRLASPSEETPKKKKKKKKIK